MGRPTTIAAASLAVCLFSTFFAPAGLALRLENFLSGGGIRPGDQVPVPDDEQVAETSPIDGDGQSVSVPPVVLSDKTKSEQPPKDKSDASNSEAGDVQKAVAESTDAIKAELGGIVAAHTEAIQGVSAAVTDVMKEVSSTLNNNLIALLGVVPVTAVAASTALQEAIRAGGLTVITAVQRLTSQVTAAAATATESLVAILTGRDPSFKAHRTLRRWKTTATLVGGGALDTMKRLARRLRVRAKTFVHRRREQRSGAQGGGKSSPRPLGADASTGEVRNYIQHVLKERLVTESDLCYQVEGEDCTAAVRELMASGSFSHISTHEVSFQVPNAVSRATIKVPTSRACWMLAALREHVFGNRVPNHMFALLLSHDSINERDMLQVSRELFALGTASTGGGKSEASLRSRVDPVSSARALYTAFVTVQLALVAHMRNNPTRVALTEATCTDDCSQAVWRAAEKAMQPTGFAVMPLHVEGSAMAQEIIMNDLVNVPCNCPRVKETVARLLSNFLSEWAAELFSRTRR